MTNGTIIKDSASTCSFTCEIGYHISSDGKSCVSDATECLTGLHISTSDGKYTNSLVKCINGDVTMDMNTTEISMPNLETVTGHISNREASGLEEYALIKTLDLPKLSKSGTIIIIQSNLSSIVFFFF